MAGINGYSTLSGPYIAVIRVIVKKPHPEEINAFPMKRSIAPVQATALNLAGFLAIRKNDSFAPVQKFLL